MLEKYQNPMGLVELGLNHGLFARLAADEREYGSEVFVVPQHRLNIGDQ